MEWARHFGGFALAFAMAVIPARADDGTLPSLPSPAFDLQQARSFLRSGRLSAADDLLRAALKAPDDSSWCLAGELAYRRGDLEAARLAFGRAIGVNPFNARAWWGLGRIEQVGFRRDAARDLFAKAYRLDPQDPDVVLAYLNYIGSGPARSTLLRNVVALTRSTSPERAADAISRLQIESRLAGREPGALVSPYTAYRLPLSEFHPVSADAHGLLITARINGGHPLRLVLDTGARGIVIHSGAARSLGLEPVAVSQIGGLGSGSAAQSSLNVANTIAFGDLVMRDCVVEVSEHDVVTGADGVLGPSIFERFIVRIDPRARLLGLAPREEPEAANAAPGALNLDRLLLVRATLPGRNQGWFLLDTGAAFTSVARPGLATPANPVNLAGAQGTAWARRTSPIPVQVAGRTLPASQTVALDLSAMSNREGIEISGILGYSSLNRTPITIDFRTGRLTIGNTSR